TMSRMLGLALLALAGTTTVGLSWASGFTETGLSLLSYQLCSYQETRTVQRLEAVQTSHVTHVACGGWILWRWCPKTIYRTQYLTVEVPESRNITDCCKGYEQLGLYCVLPLNWSMEFTSRPGVCPTANPETPISPCSSDNDCPGLQKCCPRPEGHHCVAPVSQGKAATSWYNVTVRVKMDFTDLSRVDPELQNHTRLLCSLVASALQPLDSSVHYLDSASGGPSSTVSRLLLGLPRPLVVVNVSTVLDDIPRRVCEVTSIQVQDVDECAHRALHACSMGQQCLNLEGSYRCVSPLNHTGEDCPPILDHVALNVTSSSFQVSWSVDPPRSRDFHVQVFRGEQLLQSAWTSGLALQVSGLDAGELYVVRTSYQGCSANISTMLTVKTDARVFEVIIRITNHNLTEQLLDGGSEERRTFSRQLLREVENSFPPAVSELHRMGKLRLEITSLQAGSVVATLRVMVLDPESPVGVSTLAPMLQLLRASTMFQIDPQGSRVQDRDECAHASEHDCSPAARCVNLEGSYTCQCHTARDASPTRPGRACEGDVVSPTGRGLSAALGVTALVLTTRNTALVPEPPTLSPNPRNLECTPTAAQVPTPGPLPKRGADGTVGQHRNSGGPGSSWGTTDGPVHSRGQLLGNITTEPPTLPAPTSSPTGHVEWHPSLPTQGTPLQSTTLWQEDPGPSASQGSLTVPTTVALETPACAAQKLSGKVRIANVRFSESFRNASSTEYRAFVDLFSRTVRDSLPATLRQHMDTGGIRMSITCVTNGSIVVEFDLLITVAVDVGVVSATFLDALGNMSQLEVVRNDTFIWDYDECGRGEDDCVPGTSCHNTLGTFTCSCEGGAPDSRVEYSGRACAGNSPNPGGVSWSWLSLETGCHSVAQPRLNLTGAVRVLCEMERVGIAIQKHFLQQELIPESSLYLGQPACNASVSNDSHVLLAVGWGECGTLVQSNKTSTVVKTVLRNDRSPDGIIHHPTILSPIRCIFRNDLLTSLGYTPKWGVYTVMEDLHGAGTFVTEMQLFVGDSPIPQNYSVSASDEVKVQVGLHRQKSSLKVVLVRCWATPSRDAQDPVTFGFINNSCPVPNTYTSVIQNGDSSKAQFKLRIFSFINNSIVYLHCKLRVCMESPGATCKINCNDFRVLRSRDGARMLEVSWGPLLRSAGEWQRVCCVSPGTRPHLTTSYVALIVVTALVVVAGAVALLILRYQRTTGKYSFRMQPDNFSYRVFSG
uniref:Uromodulin like 1 n=1 Tax=Cavia porcellus TaxID=10141 RepID=H0W1P1_CAVPO